MFECKLLAVRRVTQDNQGKNTAGVDQSPKKKKTYATSKNYLYK